MEPLIKHTGKIAPLDRSDVDTDAIIPKQFLKRIERTGYGKYLFYAWRYLDGETENKEFVLNLEKYKDGTILLTRKNFGCGSSREHAPWSLADYGFRVIIASSFADIFYNNCFKNSVLPVILSEENVQNLFNNTFNYENYEISIDLESKLITDNMGLRLSFEVDEYRRNMLVKGLDEIGATIQFEENIDQFERSHKIFYSL